MFNVGVDSFSRNTRVTDLLYILVRITLKTFNKKKTTRVGYTTTWSQSCLSEVFRTLFIYFTVVYAVRKSIALLRRRSTLRWTVQRNQDSTRGKPPTMGRLPVDLFRLCKYACIIIKSGMRTTNRDTPEWTDRIQHVTKRVPQDHSIYIAKKTERDN